MCEEPPELVSDLEWMLQSNQASREMLLETLAREHYAPLYHLALSLLVDPKAARQTTAAALATGLRRCGG